MSRNVGLMVLTAMLLLYSSCKKKGGSIQVSDLEVDTMHSHCGSGSGRATIFNRDSLGEIPIESQSDTICRAKHLAELSNEMVLIPAGTYMMGASDSKWALPTEFPRHKVSVDAFYMDVHEVTNAQFREFVNATGYITIAEKPIDWEELKKQLPLGTPKPTEEELQPGSLVFVAPKQVENLTDYSQWWRWVKGANWKHPRGVGSSIKGLDDHPVVQIAYPDAVAYAKWAGKRLPTEAEWEWAARGGLEDAIYPWGNEPVESGSKKCNYWTGTFPITNTKQDGFYYSAPVASFPPNGYGLYDMAGNVWELCADWFDESYYRQFDTGSVAKNPQGPSRRHDQRNRFEMRHVVRGGSFLCNDSYCSSYRVSARMPAEQDTGMNHTGFRCVKDL